jgi:hypothetical protein
MPQLVYRDGPGGKTVPSNPTVSEGYDPRSPNRATEASRFPLPVKDKLVLCPRNYADWFNIRIFV